MADFDGIYLWVMKQEDSTLAGKIVDLGDGAGLTRFGLTTKNDGAFLPVEFWTEGVTAEQALEMGKPVYRSKYWNPMRGDDITVDECAASLFSFCVNSGEKTEIEHVQRWLGLAPDGVVGQQTLTALNVQGAGDKIRAEMLAHYEAMYAANPERDGQWINGWRRRAKRVYPSLV